MSGNTAFVAVQPGDIARMKKAHPCGGREWRVIRIGADIGLECRTCGRRVFLSRDDFERRCVGLTPDAAPETDTDAMG